MPTNVIRRKRTSRKSLGPYKCCELLTGEVAYASPGYYTGYGDGVGKDLAAFINDEMRQDWEANRDELMEFWHSGKYSIDFFSDSVPHLFYRGSRRTLPWAAKQFDAKKARRRAELK
jgi:hypothetical protein